VNLRRYSITVVGSLQQRWRNGDPKRLGSLDIDDQFELRRRQARGSSWNDTLSAFRLTGKPIR